MDWDEKRKDPRFRASDKALAARGDDPYALMDLSAGGIGIRFDGEEPLPDEIRLDLLFLNRDLVLEGIRCRKVFETRKESGEPGHPPRWHVGLQFVDPSPGMIEALRRFRWTED